MKGNIDKLVQSFEYMQKKMYGQTHGDSIVKNSRWVKDMKAYLKAGTIDEQFYEKYKNHFLPQGDIPHQDPVLEEIPEPKVVEIEKVEDEEIEENTDIESEITEEEVQPEIEPETEIEVEEIKPKVKKIYVHNLEEQKSKLIPEEELFDYELLGWIKGRLKKKK